MDERYTAQDGNRQDTVGQSTVGLEPAGPETVRPKSGGLFAALPAIGLLLLGLAALASATVWPDRADDRYMLVAPPWYDAGETVALAASADGRIVQLAGLPNMLVVQSDDPAFPAALRQAGAWLVLGGMGVRGCAGGAQ